MDHRRLCVRPDCSAPAEVALTYDYSQRTVWLDDLEEPMAVGAWGMCIGHANSLTVPSGWSRVDRRGQATAQPGGEEEAEEPEGDEAAPPLAFLPPLAV
ncbi:MAG TPA: DUF3499 family protein [Acidimicrobiales bacterium]|nr:DUF3499 family protein [Acidimicrobiales bacterium]